MVIKFSEFEEYLTKQEKIQISESLRVTLGIRAIRGVKSTKLDSCRSMYVHICIS